MARRSLKSQLNQIRSWVRQGRTDAWIAHQLEVPIRDIHGFKREHDLVPDADGGEQGEPPAPAEVDLRAEDDALVAAELDAEPAEPLPAEEAQEGEGAARRRRRGRRGGARTRRRDSDHEPLEGTFDHGEEGYGLWLDPAVQDDPVYAEHWAGHRPVTVAIEPDQIVIRRAGEEEEAPEVEAPPAVAEAVTAVVEQPVEEPEPAPKPRRRARARKAAPPPEPEPEPGPNPDDFDA